MQPAVIFPFFFDHIRVHWTSYNTKKREREQMGGMKERKKDDFYIYLLMLYAILGYWMPLKSVVNCNLMAISCA
jgi:hypothetical protein